MNPGRMASIAYFRRALLFATALQSTGGNDTDRRAAKHRQAIFFAQLFSLSVRRRRTKDVRFLESPSATRASRME